VLGTKQIFNHGEHGGAWRKELGFKGAVPSMLSMLSMLSMPSMVKKMEIQS
jgi:hypothetical protein